MGALEDNAGNIITQGFFVYDGEGYILVPLQSLMGSVRGEYSRRISLTFMSMI